MKIAYIAHPIKGDVDLNLAKIAAIVMNINMKQPDVVPFAPYLGQAQLDDIPSHRARGIANNIEIISRDFIDEMWFYGPTISEGMKQELDLCFKHNIVPVAKDERLADQLHELVKKHYESRVATITPYTIIFTKQDNTTIEIILHGSSDVHAARVATSLLAIHNYKHWEFADPSISIIGTL